MEGKTQEAAAAAAGMSVRSARKWEDGPLPSATRGVRTWRTRKDPFEKVWETEIVPLLEADKEGKLEAKAVLEHLMLKKPGEFHEGQARTLQRRFRDWRALHGPDREVFFEQEHPPGQQGNLDFTEADELGVTIRGEVFAHLLFVFRLAYSGWTWATIAFTETFEALVEGLQGALWDLGGTPSGIRHDNLSAATHELKRAPGRGFNKRWVAVLDHYGAKPLRIKPRHSHQNGIAEKGHDLLKRGLEQALQLRGSRDFDTEDAYLAFVREQASDLSAKRAEKVEEERRVLLPLPSSRVPSYTTFYPMVKKHSTVRVAGRIYSVPSRLIGHRVEVRQYPRQLEVRYAEKHVEWLPRLRGEKGARIDYRHVVWSLVRKSGAFRLYRYRDQLFPTGTFRRAYGAFKTYRGERADIEYVRVLHLAASTMESAVEDALETLLARDEPFDYLAVKDLAAPSTNTVPEVRIGKPDLKAFDALLEEVR